MAKRLSKASLNGFLNYGLVILAFLVVEMMRSSGQISNSLNGQLVPICAYVCMAVSLNLTVGVLGELSLGHAGFMGVGAFSGVVAAVSLTNIIPSNGLRLLLSILIGGLLAGAAGFLVGVPVLRLRGDYLAIVTLAFGEIIKNIVNCLYIGVDSAGLHVSMTNSTALGLAEGGKVIMNGPMGATGVPKLSSFTAGFLLVLFTLFIVQNLVQSRAGRAIMAIRDNRIAAESVGIGITRYKLTAFITSAMLAGMSGALFAMNYSTIVAKKFDFNTSILVLVFVVLGGMGNIRGSIIAATVLTILPEMLRAFSDYRMLVYAIVLIVIMLATNNQKFRSLLSRALPHLREGLPAHAAGKGGSTHE
ncbi:MAG: amino acid ABC transporter permease [Oscillospiraceae bacterium]|nr:MAG: amino acid ABC transporter permease [Oscillospiraceae bacterium]